MHNIFDTLIMSHVATGEKKVRSHEATLLIHFLQIYLITDE